MLRRITSLIIGSLAFLILSSTMETYRILEEHSPTTSSITVVVIIPTSPQRAWVVAGWFWEQSSSSSRTVIQQVPSKIQALPCCRGAPVALALDQIETSCGCETWVPALVAQGEADYSMRAASTSLPRILTSIPSGGRKSVPCTIAPRASTLPAIAPYFSGSYTVRLHGFPTMGWFAPR